MHVWQVVKAINTLLSLYYTPYTNIDFDTLIIFITHIVRCRALTALVLSVKQAYMHHKCSITTISDKHNFLAMVKLVLAHCYIISLTFAMLLGSSKKKISQQISNNIQIKEKKCNKYITCLRFDVLTGRAHS